MNGPGRGAASPERAMWQMVLLLAVEDALTGPKGVKGDHEHRDPHLHWHRARLYVTKPSKDLAMVCALAGVEMDALIARMKVRLAGVPTPEEMVECPRKKAA